MDEDDEYAAEVTNEDIAAETTEDATLIESAEAWQNFLEYVDLVQSAWAPEEEDTDDYRMMRAIQLYNAGRPRPPPAATVPRPALPCSLQSPRRAQVQRLRVTSTDSNQL